MEKAVGELECDELCLIEERNESFAYRCLNDELISEGVGCDICDLAEKWTPFLFCGGCKLTVCQECHSQKSMTVIPRKPITKSPKICEVLSSPKQ